MTTVRWVTVYAGLLIGGSYAAASIVRTWAFRRTTDDPTPSHPGSDSGDSPLSPSDGRVLLAEAGVVVLCAAISYSVIEAVAPGTSAFRQFSAVGFLASRSLLVWESIALWAGLAAVVGVIAPFSSRFRNGSSGIVGAGALLLAFFPVTFLIALGTWATGFGVLRSVRATLPIVFAVVVLTEWVLSITPPRVPWGFIHGPEPTIWAAVLAGVLIARWSHGDVGRSPADQ